MPLLKWGLLDPVCADGKRGRLQRQKEHAAAVLLPAAGPKHPTGGTAGNGKSLSRCHPVSATLGGRKDIFLLYQFFS